jgi:hypothetical protein
MVMRAQTTSMLDDIHAVSLAHERFTKDRLFGDVRKRPDLSPRDRSIVTLAALIARNQTQQMPYYLNLALDNGVTRSFVDVQTRDTGQFTNFPGRIIIIGVRVKRGSRIHPCAAIAGASSLPAFSYTSSFLVETYTQELLPAMLLSSPH